MKIAMRWLSKITTGLLVVLLIGLVYLTVSTKMAGGTPKVFGNELMTVLSGSMEPKIHTGSIIAVHPGGDVTKFHVGDVITFHSPEDKNMVITHRIKQVQGSGAQIQYVTQGDANQSQDPKPVPAGNVIGQYAGFTLPYAGYILSFAKTKLGLALLLIVPGALLIIWQMVSLIRTIIRMDREKKGPNQEATHV